MCIRDSAGGADFQAATQRIHGLLFGAPAQGHPVAKPATAPAVTGAPHERSRVL